MISVVLPTLDEEKNVYYRRILARLYHFKELEIIVVDGGSRDATVNIAREFGIEPTICPNSNRAKRLNVGIGLCTRDMVLLHHPRSLIDVGGLSDLIENQELDWGGFKHKFDDDHVLLRFTSWYSTQIRFRLFGIVYLDHCIFAKRELLNLCGGLAEVDIFEDTILSRALRRVGKPHLIPYEALTSAIRFQENGYLKQALINQWCKLGFFLRRDLRNLNARYEGELALNARKVAPIPKSVIKQPRSKF